MLNELEVDQNTSPRADEPFEDKILPRPTIMARKLIIAWREQHGLPTLAFGQPVRPSAPWTPHPVAHPIMKPTVA
jgi:hypothetical protein